MATSRRLELYSPLTRAECLERLSAKMDLENSFVPLAIFFGPRAIIGRIDGHCLQLRQQTGLGRLFRMFFNGIVRPCRDGTAIEGEFSPHFLVSVFAFICSLGVFLGAGFYLEITVLRFLTGTRSYDLWLGVLIPALSVLAMVVIPRLLRGAAEAEMKFVENFLRETLEAVDEKIAGAEALRGGRVVAAGT